MNEPRRGRFVVLEGADGSGKSTQVARLAERLRASGREVVETFEPGATVLGARVRSLLLDGHAAIDPVAEALLMAADRAQHVAEVVRPALVRGAWVVSDRFVPSSLVYQGIARNLGVEEVASASAWATGDLEPDLIVVLDVTDAVADARRTRTDRLEREAEAFHAIVREAYRDLATARGWTIVDGTDAAGSVADRIWTVVEEECGG